MTPEEHKLLKELFDRIDATDVGALDPEADALIRRRIAANPTAPYAMAQTIAVQNRLLEKADARIRALEAETARPEGAAGAGEAPSSPAWNVPGRAGTAGASTMAREADAAFAGSADRGRTSVPAMGARPIGGGGGFLAGAGQVALGVAGGVLLGSAIGSLLADDAAAAPAEASGGEEAGAAEPQPAEPDAGGAADAGMDDPGLDGGGFFDGMFGE